MFVFNYPKYWFDYFIYFIFFIKLIYFILLIYSFVLVIKDEKNTQKYDNIIKIKKGFEFIFIISMSILLIYLFNPNKNCFIIDNNVKVLLFAYGIIIILNAPWSLFISKTLVYKYINDHLVIKKKT